jgi:hypothetical protein
MEKKDLRTISSSLISYEKKYFFNEREQYAQIAILSITLIICTLTIKYYRQNSKLRKIIQEKDKLIQDQEAEILMLKKITVSHDDIMHLAKNDAPLFLSHFKVIYAYFYERLMEIQPDLSISEQKFCFYLRLNFSTKEISTYTFVTPKAVQNRKNRLRKRLYIPPNIDIYIWIEKLG